MMFAYPYVLLSGFCLLITFFMLRIWLVREPEYFFPYVALFNRLGVVKQRWFTRRRIVHFLRLISLIMLVIATARPRTVTESIPSTIDVSGDIVLALDMSGSMTLFDDLKDRRSRFEVAQKEALNFIMARKTDPIGLVIFATTAVFRCPVTLDKQLLQTLVRDLKIGDINPEGTALAIGLGMAVNRLRSSSAKNKVVILLTDGAPSPHDIDPLPVISLAKKYGIKVYTIGVGSPEGGYTYDMFGRVMSFQTPINEELLRTIAHETGAEFFKAKRPEDIKKVYQLIDQLEKSAYDSPLYVRYHEWFMIFVGLALGLFLLERILVYLWRIL